MSVDKLNSIAITDIEKVNDKTDANIQAFNGVEFAGYGGLTWSTGGTDAVRKTQGTTGTIAAFLMTGVYSS